MSVAFIEPMYGLVDGVNQIFQTKNEYMPGTLRVFVNGVVYYGPFDDGWTELGDRKIRMKIAPVVGDVIQAYYVPRQG